MNDFFLIDYLRKNLIKGVGLLGISKVVNRVLVNNVNVLCNTIKSNKLKCEKVSCFIYLFILRSAKVEDLNSDKARDSLRESLVDKRSADNKVDIAIGIASGGSLARDFLLLSSGGGRDLFLLLLLFFLSNIFLSECDEGHADKEERQQ